MKGNVYILYHVILLRMSRSTPRAPPKKDNRGVFWLGEDDLKRLMMQIAHVQTDHKLLQIRISQLDARLAKLERDHI